MSYKVRTISVFESQAKRLIKKYPSLKKELISLINALKENPKQGVSLKHNCYKIRLSIRSKGTGKSGGARIITHVVYKETSVYLLNIYDKSHKNNITDKELKDLIKGLPE
jgi:hypothetical protein